MNHPEPPFFATEKTINLSGKTRCGSPFFWSKLLPSWERFSTLGSALSPGHVIEGEDLSKINMVDVGGFES